MGWGQGGRAEIKGKEVQCDVSILDWPPLPPTYLLYCRMKKLMHRVTFPWELKMINTTDDCPDAGGGERARVCVCGCGWGDCGGLPAERSIFWLIAAVDPPIILCACTACACACRLCI